MVMVTAMDKVMAQKIHQNKIAFNLWQYFTAF